MDIKCDFAPVCFSNMKYERRFHGNFGVSNFQKAVDLELSISYSKQLFEKFLKFQRDMTHLIVHLVKINEARFLFDDIFSICTSSYIFSHEANEALSATLAL